LGLPGVALSVAAEVANAVMAKGKVTAPHRENGANGSTIRETVRAR
jgi:hypothetical protein